MAYLKKVRTEIKPGVDLATGEVKDFQIPEHILISEHSDKYTMWLDNFGPVIKKIEYLSDIKLLYWIGRNLQWEEYVITLSKTPKLRIAKEMNVSKPAIDRSIKVLKDFKVIIPYPGSVREAIFYVNPCFLWRGTEAKRKKAQAIVLELIRVNGLPEKEREDLQAVEQFSLVNKDAAAADKNYKGVKMTVTDKNTHFDFSKILPAKSGDANESIHNQGVINL